MYIYNNDDLSSFLDTNRVSNTNEHVTNTILSNLRNLFINNNRLILDNQNINTENDLKCILFCKIRQINCNINFEIHSEEADKIAINNEYCINLTENGDIPNENTTTRKTDLTITIDPIEGEETNNIQKGYSRFGRGYIDFELKYIRKGFTTNYLRDIRRDLCKLKYLVDQNPNITHHDQNTPTNFGIFFLGFRKLSILQNYLDNGLRDKIINFNNIENVAILLFYKED